MKPYIHAKNSVRKYGGAIDDYLPIHNWFDSSKSTYADIRHRAILHTSFGIYLCEQIFGIVITNADGKEVSVRDIGEDHVAEDFGGTIPTVQDWLSKIQLEDWMFGHRQKEIIKKSDIIPTLLDKAGDNGYRLDFKDDDMVID